MLLKGKFKVLGIKKKTKAVLFRHLEVGDVVEVSYSINGSHGYAPSIMISLGNLKHHNNALQFTTNMQNFEVEQIA